MPYASQLSKMRGGFFVNVNSVISAISSGDALQQAIGLTLMNKVKDTSAVQASTLLQDFAKSQQQIAASVTPHLGQSIDVRL
jgi:hypothetical protein